VFICGFSFFFFLRRERLRKKLTGYLLCDRPTADIVVGLGQLGQDRFEIKTFGNLELAGGRRRIQLDNLDLLNFF